MNFTPSIFGACFVIGRDGLFAFSTDGDLIICCRCRHLQSPHRMALAHHTPSAHTDRCRKNPQHQYHNQQSLRLCHPVCPSPSSSFFLRLTPSSSLVAFLSLIACRISEPAACKDPTRPPISETPLVLSNVSLVAPSLIPISITESVSSMPSSLMSTAPSARRYLSSPLYQSALIAPPTPGHISQREA